MLWDTRKSISELHKANYRTVLRRNKAGNREVSILSMEEETWESRKGKGFKWSGCVCTVSASVYMYIHIYVYVQFYSSPFSSTRERSRIMPLVLFVFMWTLHVLACAELSGQQCIHVHMGYKQVFVCMLSTGKCMVRLATCWICGHGCGSLMSAGLLDLTSSCCCLLILLKTTA